MEESTILFAVTQTSKTLLEMKTRWRLVSINGIFVSATAHRQAGASPSLCSKGAAALNSATLKWLKAVLGPQKMKMPRSAVSWSQSHRDCTAQRLPQRSLCPVPGTGLQSVLCRIAYHSRITGFGLFMCSHRISSCWHLGVSFVCLFAFFNRFFSILTHHTAQRAQKAFCQPYPVFNSGFFFFFFPPVSSKWELNMKFGEEHDPHDPYSTFNMSGSQLISQGFKTELLTATWIPENRADDSAGMSGATLVFTQISKTKIAICLELNESVVTQKETLLPRLTPCFLKFSKDKTWLF